MTRKIERMGNNEFLYDNINNKSYFKPKAGRYTMSRCSG